MTALDVVQRTPEQMSRRWLRAAPGLVQGWRGGPVLLSFAEEQPAGLDFGDFEEAEDNLGRDCHPRLIVVPGPVRDAEDLGKLLAPFLPI